MSTMKILVTGASSGIGRATAELLVKKGHHVLMAARRKDMLKAIAAETPQVVGEFSVGTLDVSDPKSVTKFVEKHGDWLKDLDVLVNNAGLALGRESLDKQSAEDVRTVIDTNVLGFFEVTRAILPFLVARKRGHLVNLGSIAAHAPYQGGAVYCATKAAVHVATEALRQDLAGTGVRVTTVAPGRVATDFSLVRFKGDERLAKKVYEGFRPLTAEDIAETIAWVIERPAHVNIQEVVVMPTDQPTSTTVVPLAP